MHHEVGNGAVGAERATVARVAGLRGQELSPREGITAALLFTAFFIAYFSPVTFSGGLLAPGDGLVYYLPALLSRWVLWNPNLYAGHPSFADVQALAFSPLRLFGEHYNAAVTAVHVLAACGAYALARTLTGLRGAGAIAGLVYSSGGAMIAHIGHLTIIYSAAWMPWMLYAVVRARSRRALWPPAMGAAAIAASAWGGHPQIFVYGLLLGLVYALYSLLLCESSMRREMAIRYVILFGAGLALAGVQLVPLAELGEWSLRHQLSFTEFTTYALAPRELLLFFFPRILGSYAGFDVGYFGPWNLNELACYAGIATLLLAVAGMSARARRPEALFWALVVLVSVLYALGRSTPLAEVAFRLPGLNQFRAPARTAFVTTLALAVLAAMGYQAIVCGRLSGAARRNRLVMRGGSLIALALIASYAAYPGIARSAAASGVTLPGWFGNPAVQTGLVAMAASVAAVFWLWRRGAQALVFLLVLLVVDLGAFGWRFDWRAAPTKAQVMLDPEWKLFAEDVRRAHARVLFVNGAVPVSAPAGPNLNLLYNLPSAGAYGPLVLRAYADVFGVDPTGAVTSLAGLQRRLQLTGTQWLAGGGESRRSLHLGGDCTPRPGPMEAFAQLAAGEATHVEVISHLGCAVGVEQDSPVLAITVSRGSIAVGEATLRAGRDTAEWAIDRPDVAAAIRHGRAPDSEAFPAGDFNGRWFRTLLPLRPDGGAQLLDELKLRWLQPPGPGITLRSVELVNAQNGARRRIAADDLMWGNEVKQAEARSLPGAAWVRRVESVGPIAWLVTDAAPLARDAALAAIREGRLPDGGPFDPYATVLLPPDYTVMRSAKSTASVGEVRVVDRRGSTVTIEAQLPVDGYLVHAESFYPGWTATIDGKPVPVLQGNVAFQAVAFPAGRHTVVFSFVPRSLLLGVGVAVAGFAVLIAHLIYAARSRRRRVAGDSSNASVERPQET